MPDFSYLDLIGPGGEALKQQAQLIENQKAFIATLKESNNTAKKLEFGAQGSKTLKDAVDLSQKLVDANGKLVGSYQQLSTATQAYTSWKAQSNGQTDSEMKGTGKVLQLKKEEERVRALAAKAQDAENRSRISGLRAIEAQERATQRSNKASEAEAKILADLTNEYKLISKAQQEAALRAKNYALHLGEAHPITLEAQQDADKLATILKRLDARTGDHKRSVGDYTIATRGLQGSIQQIARELPSLSGGFAIFASAIGNNIAPAADAIAQFRAEQKALAAEGKPTTSLFKALGASILNFQTLLLVGVTLLTVYGKEIGEFGKSLFTAGTGLSKAAASAEAFNEALKSNELKEAVTQIDTLREYVQLAKEGFIDKEKVLRFYNETVGKTMGTLTDFADVENRLVESGPAYLAMTLKKAAAEAARAKVTENMLKAAESQADIDELAGRAFIDPIANLQTKYFQFQQKAAVKNQETFKQIADGFLAEAAKIAAGNKFDLFGGELDEKKTKERKKRVEDLTDDLRRLQESMREFAISLATPQKAELDKIFDDIQKGIDAASGKIETGIFDKHAEENAKAKAKALEDILREHGERKAKLTKEQEAKQAEIIERANKLAQSASAFAGELGNLNSALSARRIQEIDAEIEAINKKRDADILAIEQSGLSEEERVKRIAGIKAQAAIEEEKLERDANQRKHKAAVFQKAVTLAQIVAETALAVVKTLREVPWPANIAQAVAIGALGAAKFAVVAAQPIPQYAKGVEHSPEGPAIVGEKGREIRIDPDGSASLTPGKATLTYLKKGTKIIPAHKISEMAKMYGLGLPVASPLEKERAIDLGQVVGELQGVRQAIERKPVQGQWLTWQGVLNQAKIGNSTVERLRNMKH